MKLTINDQVLEAQEGATVLEVCRKAGIFIPTLCYNRKLSTYGGCRLCMVEVVKGKRSRIVASCVYPVEEGLVVKTETDKLNRIRKTLIELLLPHSDTGPLRELAKRYGIEESRFTADASDCILCGLCVRYCAEIRKADAVYFQHRGVNRKLAAVAEKSGTCISCKQCYELCPSGLIVEMAEEMYK